MKYLVIFYIGVFTENIHSTQIHELHLENFVNGHPHHKPDGRIIGGKEAVPHSVKHMVGLTVMHPNGRLEYCGGSLLSDRHILTAGHCLHQGKKVHEVILGAHNRWTNESSQIRRYKATHILHEKYNSTPKAHDIAMIKLDQPVDLNAPYIAVANLPDVKDANNTYLNDTLRAYGWGIYNQSASGMDQFPEHLLTVNLTVIPNDICRDIVKKAVAPKPGYVYEYEICTNPQTPEGPKGVCGGDSGSPIMVNETQVALVSRGLLHGGRCISPLTHIFVSVGPHLQWIKDKMNTM